MNESPSPEVVQIDIGRVLPNPLNPRGEITEAECAEMAASMQSVGVLQPLLVTPYRAGYYAVAGHRRRMAARLAGLTRVPCIVRELTDSQQLDIMMIENLQRADLTPYQEACGFEKMIEIDGCSVADIVRRIGMSESYINSRRDILKLDEGTQEVFKKGGLPIGAAPLLNKIADAQEQRRYAMMLSSGVITIKRLSQLVLDRRDRPTRAPRTNASSVGRPPGGAKLGENEAFTRRDAIEALKQGIIDRQDGAVISFADIIGAFDDVCDGLCEESDLMCQSCPAPRMVASMLRRMGINIQSKSVS